MFKILLVITAILVASFCSVKTAHADRHYRIGKQANYCNPTHYYHPTYYYVYNAPIYNAPIYNSPIYQSSIYQSSIYNSPIYNAPIYNAPIYYTYTPYICPAYNP